MEIRVLDNIDSVEATEWNPLLPNQDTQASPFLRHEFLSAIEHAECIGQQHGWLPRHIAIYVDDRIVAATPLYIKFNSYGEFVFDWAWADAYQRSGLLYYPKLVSAIPYTPATGQRLLVREGEDADKLKTLLIESTIQFATQENMSSVHWLFPDANDRELLYSSNLLKRIDTQFHWNNHSYTTFDDFLHTLTSSRRKKIKRERKRVEEQNIIIRSVEGDKASPQDILLAEYFYRSTFDKKHGYATFNEKFFTEISNTMGSQLVLFFAEVENKTIACSICYRSDTTLYGRHWGCSEELHSLHFELCYYQGIEYCIKHSLQLFEPGAQGEHKISRGFLPVTVYSAHWIAHPEFKQVISQHLDQERPAIESHQEELFTHSPYKK